MTINCNSCKKSFTVTKQFIPGQSYRVPCPYCWVSNIVTAPVQQNAQPENVAATTPQSGSGTLLVGPSKSKNPGWLVVHDERTRQQIFELKIGQNIIGKLASAYKPNAPVPSIKVDTKDTYMSRTHCLVEVKQTTSGYQILLSDPNWSLNGTRVNGNAKDIKEGNLTIYLYDGDTIQVGETKLVLKTTPPTPESAVREVENTPFERTVLLNNIK